MNTIFERAIWIFLAAAAGYTAFQAFALCWWLHKVLYV